jgi:hypothetical protein
MQRRLFNLNCCAVIGMFGLCIVAFSLGIITLDCRWFCIMGVHTHRKYIMCSSNLLWTLQPSCAAFVPGAAVKQSATKLHAH